MSATAVYGSAAIICVASLVIGQAVLATCGWRTWSWLAPAVGLATLIVVAGATVRLPGHGIAGAIGMSALLIASLVRLRGRASELAKSARAGLALGLIVILAASIPFAASGRIDLLGVQVLDDLAIHLVIGDHILTGEGPHYDLLDTGYPLGGQAVAIGISKGTGLSFDATFTGLLLAVPILTALTALTALGDLPRWRRTVVAVLVALPYLAVGFFVQFAFKETILALLLLAFALTLRELRPVGEQGPLPRGPARAAPLGLLAAASVYVYSYPGAAWLAGTALLWGLCELVFRDRRRSVGVLAIAARRGLPELRVAAGILLIGLAPEAVWLATFADSPTELGRDQLVNLFDPLPPYEALGVWPSPDYRFAPPGALEWLSAALGFVAVAFGCLWSARRLELALLGAISASLLIHGVTQLASSPFYQAKTLAIMAPVAMLIAAGSLLARSSEGPRVAAARGALALVFVVAAAHSSYLGLQGARVDTPEQGAELAKLRAIIGDRPTLYLGRDKFAAWDLRGANVASPAPSEWPGRQVPSRPEKRFGFLAFEPLDFDNVRSEDLDRYSYAITSRSPYRSRPPKNFRSVAATRSFTLWARRGPTPARRTLVEGPAPGTIARCTPADRRNASRVGGRAGVFTVPPVVYPGEWQPVPGTGPSDSPDLRRTVDLPSGRWRVSLQYISQTPLELRAPGLRVQLPANMDHLATFWPAGMVRTNGGELAVTLHVTGRSWFARLSGRQFLDSQFVPERVGGQIAFVRADSYAVIPLKRACGRYVDWFTTRGGFGRRDSG